MSKRVVSYTETIAIQAFLGYLSKHYSKLINNKDTYLIAAVAAWFYQESGGEKRVIGNNPFNIRPGLLSFMSNGYRQAGKNGKFLTFASLSKGFEAAAYLLIHGSKAYGYQIALNALKNGGNQAAVNFLAALAMSSWDAAHYGVSDWLNAYDQQRNHLLSVYASITGVQIGNPHPKPPKPRPLLPRDFNYHVVVRNYLDPWAAGQRYAKRHNRMTVGTVDATNLKR